MMSLLADLSDSSRLMIEPHICPKCSGPMVLTRIKPSRIGFDMRVFQGVNCGHVDKVVTETDSMKWISSRLRPPV
jgi:hypothetical protein